MKILEHYAIGPSGKRNLIGSRFIEILDRDTLRVAFIETFWTDFKLEWQIQAILVDRARDKSWSQRLWQDKHTPNVLETDVWKIQVL